MGKSATSIDLVVKSKVLSPVVLKRLQNSDAVLGKRFVVDVEVGGTPPPAVTWFKDGRRLVAEKNRLLVQSAGCRHTLIIHEPQVCRILLRIECLKKFTGS